MLRASMRRPSAIAVLISVGAVAFPVLAAPLRAGAAPAPGPRPGPGPAGAVCQRLAGHEPPAVDRPTPSQLRTLAGCASEALYYGETGPEDFVKARLCAFREAQKGEGGSRTGPVFSGETILMQLYANGLGGVKRNLDQATAFACDIDGAPAEIEGRVAHLQSLKTKAGGPRFDYCDDITSGMAEGFCAARDADIAKKGRAARAAALERRAPPAARAALNALRMAADAFVSARGGEVDETGTARAQMVIDEEETTRNAFEADLARLVDARWPGASRAEARVADGSLNGAYKRALSFLASKDNLTTVKPDDVRKAQRAWIAYRDAFIAFAAKAAPGLSREALVRRLSAERTSALADLST